MLYSVSESLSSKRSQFPSFFANSEVAANSFSSKQLISLSNWINNYLSENFDILLSNSKETLTVKLDS